MTTETEVARVIACELARIDGFDPEDKHGGLYDLRWSIGSNPEPLGDAWQMDYMPKGERIARALAAISPPPQVVTAPSVNAEVNQLRYLAAACLEMAELYKWPPEWIGGLRAASTGEPDFYELAGYLEAAAPTPRVVMDEDVERAQQAFGRTGWTVKECGGCNGAGVVKDQHTLDGVHCFMCSGTGSLGCRNEFAALRAALESFAASGEVSGWRSIETAPKDGTRVLLLRQSGGVVCGRWNIDQYAKTPRPYWSTDTDYIEGIRVARVNKPRAWMPLPPPPAKEVGS